MTDSPMQAAIAAVWKKNLPLLQEKMAVLRRAAEQLAATRTLDADLRAQAHSTAHKLAGSMGMFGLHSATDVSRAIEHELEKDGLPQPEFLQRQVDRLQEILEPHLNP